jgi:cytochrome oxidase Cu insertion factor (SCO1/SenC/PrrC family)
MNARRVLIPVVMIAVCAVILVIFNLTAVNTGALSPTSTPAPPSNPGLTALPTSSAAIPPAQQPPSSVPAVGALAPDFTLLSAWGDPVTLSRYRGDKNIVLLFYRTSG